VIKDPAAFRLAPVVVRPAGTEPVPSALVLNSKEIQFRVAPEKLEDAKVYVTGVCDGLESESVKELEASASTLKVGIITASSKIDAATGTDIFTILFINMKTLIYI
jgi:hypothetical protein